MNRQLAKNFQLLGSGASFIRQPGEEHDVHEAVRKSCSGLTRDDSDGIPLDGSKANYTITFAKDALPPLKAFWSITIYDGKTNPDGSLTIHVQNKSPGADKESN
jgi:hypothetical protein